MLNSRRGSTASGGLPPPTPSSSSKPSHHPAAANTEGGVVTEAMDLGWEAEAATALSVQSLAVRRAKKALQLMGQMASHGVDILSPQNKPHLFTHTLASDAFPVNPESSINGGGDGGRGVEEGAVGLSGEGEEDLNATQPPMPTSVSPTKMMIETLGPSLVLSKATFLSNTITAPTDGGVMQVGGEEVGEKIFPEGSPTKLTLATPLSPLAAKALADDLAFRYPNYSKVNTEKAEKEMKRLGSSSPELSSSPSPPPPSLPYHPSITPIRPSTSSSSSTRPFSAAQHSSPPKLPQPPPSSLEGQGEEGERLSLPPAIPRAAAARPQSASHLMGSKLRGSALEAANTLEDLIEGGVGMEGGDAAAALPSTTQSNPSSTDDTLPLAAAGGKVEEYSTLPASSRLPIVIAVASAVIADKSIRPPSVGGARKRVGVTSATASASASASSPPPAPTSTTASSSSSSKAAPSPTETPSSPSPSPSSFSPSSSSLPPPPPAPLTIHIQTLGFTGPSPVSTSKGGGGGKRVENKQQILQGTQSTAITSSTPSAPSLPNAIDQAREDAHPLLHAAAMARDAVASVVEDNRLASLRPKPTSTVAALIQGYNTSISSHFVLASRGPPPSHLPLSQAIIWPWVEYTPPSRFDYYLPSDVVNFKAAWDALDADGSGMVEADEILNGASGLSGSMAPQALRIAKSIFASADTDQSGELSMMELLSVQFPLANKGMKNAMMRYIAFREALKASAAARVIEAQDAAKDQVVKTTRSAWMTFGDVVGGAMVVGQAAHKLEVGVGGSKNEGEALEGEGGATRVGGDAIVGRFRLSPQAYKVYLLLKDSQTRRSITTSTMRAVSKKVVGNHHPR